MPRYKQDNQTQKKQDGYMKEAIRIATVSGKGVKNRCRKEEHIFCEGIGLTDKEALENLNIHIKKTVSQLKSYKFNESIHLCDASREDDGIFKSVISPVCPNWTPLENNFVCLSFAAEVAI